MCTDSGSKISSISTYLSQLRKNLAHGDATEHTHRPTLKNLIETLGTGITSTNESKRVNCGGPKDQGDILIIF